jgi:SOS-response transcriptional repressor LexA
MTEGLARLWEAMAEEIPPVPFVGSGFSVAATSGAEHASWRGLLLDGIKVCLRVGSPMPPGWAGRMKEQLDNADAITYIAAADDITRRLRAVREGREFGSWIQRTVGGLHPTPEGKKIIEAVRKLGKDKRIVTTNYDTLIEGPDQAWRPITWKDDKYGSVQELSKVVVHMHGIADKPDSIILSSADYERLSDQDLVKVLNQAFFASHRFIFIGCGDGLTDPDISPLMEFVRKVIPEEKEMAEHFILVTGGQLRQLNERPLSPRITPVAYGENFSELTQFLRDLAAGKARDISQDPEYYERRAAAGPATALLDLAAPGWDKLNAARDALRRAVRMMEQVESRKALPDGMADWDYRDQRAVHGQLAASVRDPAMRLKSYLVQVDSAFQDAALDIGRLASPDFTQFAAELQRMTDAVSALEDQTWHLLLRVGQARDDLKARTGVSTDYRIPSDTLSSAHDSADDANETVRTLKDGLARLQPDQAAGTRQAIRPESEGQEPGTAPGEPSEATGPELRLIPKGPARPEQASPAKRDSPPDPNAASAQPDDTALTEPDEAAPDDTGSDEIDNEAAQRGTVRAPLLWEIAAGTPMLAADNVRDYLLLPDQYVPSEVIVFEVRGDSMTGDDGVLDGDYVIVSPGPTWEDGDMVVVFIGSDENSAVVKRIWREGDSVHLQSSNPVHDTQIYPRDEVIVQGKVIGVTRWHVKKGRRRPDLPS